MMQFIPFSEIKKKESDVVVVDSFYPNCLTLSHWRGAPKLGDLHDDTSTGIVLNVLERTPELLAGYRYVTNNHFDIDGFLGIWSVCNPELALRHASLFRKMALLGDFREMKLESAEDHKALQLVCWLNAVEKEEFYAPFATYAPGQSEPQACVAKYQYFLKSFQRMLEDPERGRRAWQPEYAEVVNDMGRLRSSKTRLLLEEGIRLLIVETPEPLHYFALFSQSAKADMVLSLYSEGRYELEYKYTSWVDTAHRIGFPRINLQPLADRLNQYETSEARWQADKITDTGPILRLSAESLSKEQRFGSPKLRPLHRSGIPAEEMKMLVCQYFRTVYADKPRKTLWTWEEMKKLNRALSPHSAA